MCGLVLLYGECGKQRIKDCLSNIKHRGGDGERFFYHQSISLGFTRMAINDLSDAGLQPFEYKGLVCVANGEVLNAESIKNTYHWDISTSSDCSVIAPLFYQYGTKMLDYLDGFFAGVILDQRKGRLFVFRDDIGKKPLFIGKSGTEFFIVSELKAMDDIDWFQEVGSGIYELDINQWRLLNCYQRLARKTNRGIQVSEMKEVLEQAVVKRLQSDVVPIAVFLSGGLDSSIITSIALKNSKDVVYVTLADPKSPDLVAVELLKKEFGLDIQVVPLPKGEELGKVISKVVACTDSFNPSVISNGVGIYILAHYVRMQGIKVALSGEGADELFGGYYRWQEENDDWQEKRRQLIEDMKFTELRRIDLCGMAHAVEIRCPFLDKQVVDLAMQGDFENFYYQDRDKGKVNKWVLRQAFRSDLPKGIIDRKKISFDVGSGLRKAVKGYLHQINPNCKEREVLQAMWEQQTNYAHLIDETYFSHYPAFDRMIDKRAETHGK
jgi:asparagine synthase (glutamine-hydrolysing)